MNSDQNWDLWKFLYLGHQFILCKYFKKVWEFIKISKKILKGKFLNEDITKLSVNFQRSQFLLNFVFKASFGILDSNTKKLSSLFFRIKAFSRSNYHLQFKIAE